MNLDGLSAYAVNTAYRDGVIITLDEAPDYKFRVVLPGGNNRAYLAAMAKEMSVDRNEIDTYLLSEQLFLEHCLVSINDEPVPADFHLTHTPALQEIMRKATDMAAEIQEESGDAAKKSVTTSSGRIAGVVG